MKISCNIFPNQIENPNTGKVEDSKLFWSLYHALGNREVAITIYTQALTSAFQKDSNYPIEYNDQGEPTMKSVQPLIEAQYPQYTEDAQLSNLNSKYNKTVNTAEEAKSQAMKFSKENASSDYIPRITKVKDDEGNYKYLVSIVAKDNAENVQALMEFVREDAFYQKLVELLQMAGIKLNIIESLENEALGRFTTDPKFFEKCVDTCMACITLSTKINDKEVSKSRMGHTLCHEIGHFIVQAAKNSEDSEIKKLFDRLDVQLINNKESFIAAILQYRQEHLQPILGSIQDTIDSNASNSEIIAEFLGDILFATKGTLDLPTQTPGLKQLSGMWKLTARLAKSTFRLFNKVWNIIKDKYQTNKSSKVGAKAYLDSKAQIGTDVALQVKQEVLNSAQVLINSFLQSSLSAKDAAKTRETHYQHTLQEVKALQNLANSMNMLIVKLKDRGSYNRGRGKSSLQEILNKLAIQINQVDITQQGTNQTLALLQSNAIQQMTQLMRQFSALCEEIKGDSELLGDQYLLDMKNTTLDGLPYLKNLTKNLKIILACRDLLTTLEEAKLTANMLIQTFENNSSAYELWNLFNDIQSIENKLSSLVVAQESSYFKAIMVASTQDLRATRRVEKMLVKTTKMGISKYETLEKDPLEEGNFVSSIDNYTEEDMSLLSVYCNAFNRNPDIVAQAYERMVNHAKYRQNETLLLIKRKMYNLQNEMRETLGTNSWEWALETYTEDVYDANGEILYQKGEWTGNFKTKYNWGLWEHDFDLYKAQEKAKFDESHAGLSAQNRYAEWQQYWGKKYIEWHELHSYRVEDPSDPYGEVTFVPDLRAQMGRYAVDLNTSLDADPEIARKKAILLNKLMALKNELDVKVNFVRAGAAVNHRIPQFRGSTYNLIQNNMKTSNIFRSSINAFKDEFSAAFYQDALDEDFGDLTCYDIDSDTVDLDVSTRMREMRRRITTFGIKKLPPRELCTDMVFSMMSYAAMATNAESMRLVSLVGEIGEDVLSRRKYKGVEQGKSQVLGVTQSFTRFLDMHVFNKYRTLNLMASFSTKAAKDVSGKTKTKFLVGTKAAEKLNTLITTTILAGRVPSAIVNTGTGAIQFLTTASIGRYYDRKEMFEAIFHYYKGITESVGKDTEKGQYISNLTNTHNDRRVKLYNFISFFDTKNQGSKAFVECVENVSKLTRNMNAMWAYEWGDNLVQTVPYLAAALHIKTYTIEDADTANQYADPSNKVRLSDDQMLLEGNLWSSFNNEQFNNNVRNRHTRNPYARLNEDGTTDYTKTLFVKNDDGSFSEITPEYLSQFMEKMRYHVEDLHGLYNTKGQASITKTALGLALTSMKKFIPAYVNSLYGSNKYSLVNQEFREGAFNSLSLLMGYRWQNAKEDYGKKAPWAMLKHRESWMALPAIFSSFGTLSTLFAWLPDICLSVLSTYTSSNLMLLFTYMLYDTISSSIFGARKHSIKGLLGGTKVFGEFGSENTYANKNLKKFMSTSQIEGLKRWDSMVKTQMITQLLAMLLSMGGIELPDDEDDEAYPLFNLDAILLDLIGITDDYEEIQEKWCKKIEKSGKVKHNGILFNLAMDALEDNPELQYWTYFAMSQAYYFLRRWQLEREFLSPLAMMDIIAGHKEVSTQFKELTRVLPVSVTWFIDMTYRLANVNESTYKYKHNPDIKEEGHNIFTEAGWEDIMNASERDGDVVGSWIGDMPLVVAPTGQTAATFLLALPGAHTTGGRAIYLNFIPYLNFTPVLSDGYQAAESYASGRYMGK